MKGGRIDPPPPEKTTLKKPCLIRVKYFFKLSLRAIDNTEVIKELNPRPS